MSAGPPRTRWAKSGIDRFFPGSTPRSPGTGPGGAVALPPLLSGKFDAQDKTVAITLSGGEVDPAVFAEAITTAGPD